jgi:glyoxylase I family protein
MFTGIEHTAIAALDTNRLAAFYVEHLDFKIAASVDNGPGKQPTHFVQLGGTFLEIMPAAGDLRAHARQNPDRGMSHVAILATDFDAAVQRVNASGAPREGGERAGPWGSRIQFYRDPEGNLFHLLWRERGI